MPVNFSRFVRLCALSLMLASAAHADDTVALSFAWPAQVDAKVSTTLQRTRDIIWTKGSAKTQPPQWTGMISGTYAMHAATSAEDGRTHVAFDSLQLSSAAGEAGEATLTVTELAPLFPLAFEPPFVAARGATLVDVERTEDFRATLAALVLSGIEDADGRERMRGFVPGLLGRDTSDERLLQLTATRWNSRVGFWNGRTLAQGKAARWTTMQRVPVPGNPDIPYQYELEYLRRIPCSEKENLRRCVELRLVAEVAEKDLSDYAAANSFAKQMQIEIGEMRIECRLVTDPDTLLPYRYDQSTRQSMRMIEKGLTTEFRMQDDLEMVYSYAGT
jgi:hypothetical protein